MENKKINLQIFRYHLLPINHKSKQLKAFPDKKLSEAEIIKNKNKFFESILKDLALNHNISHPLQLAHQDGDYFLFKIAQIKKATITQNFENKEFPNEPYSYVIINNKDDVQKIAISDNVDAFSKPETVKNILKKSFNRDLEQYGLNIEIEPLFNSIVFWDYILKYKDVITMVNFQFVKPNMAKISKTLPDDFKRFSENVNSHESNIIIKAPEKGALENISKENDVIKGLVEYSSQGGGNIRLKVKNIRKQLNTKEKPLVLEIRELDIEGAPEQVILLYKEIVS